MPAPERAETRWTSALLMPVVERSVSISHAHFGGPGRIDLVDLAHHRDALGHPEQVEDGDVLAGLRHHPVVGRDHHQREIDGPDPRQHVAHEALVSGDVDEAEHLAAVQRVVGEPEIDGQSPLLLLGETIGVDPGERPHERGLAVVDVARSGDDHGAAEESGCAAEPVSPPGQGGRGASEGVERCAKVRRCRECAAARETASYRTPRRA